MNVSAEVAKHAKDLARSNGYEDLPNLAFCTERFLNEVLSDQNDPCGNVFELILYQNYRFGDTDEPSALNETQKKLILLDNWIGRIGNSGAGTMFVDPNPQFCCLWASVDLLAWPKLSKLWRKAILNIVNVTEAQIEIAISEFGPEQAGDKLFSQKFSGRFCGLDIWEKFSPQERNSISSIEEWMHKNFHKLDRYLIEAIWQNRVRLIQPHPDGKEDPTEWYVSAKPG